MKKPHDLEPKPKIALILPACGHKTTGGSAEKDAKKLEGLGFEVVYYDNADSKKYPFPHSDIANTPEERARQIINFAQDPEIVAMWAVNGGESAPEVAKLLVEYRENPEEYLKNHQIDPISKIKLEYHENAKNGFPKDRKLPTIVGMSDISNIQIALSKFGFPSFYANVTLMPTELLIQAAQIIKDQSHVSQLTDMLKLAWKEEGLEEENLPTKISGPVYATVDGGLRSSLGTDWQPHFLPGTILMLEGVHNNEYLTKILTQMRDNGALDNVQAIIIGRTGDGTIEWNHKTLRKLQSLGVPVFQVSGQFGHLGMKVEPTPIANFGEMTINTQTNSALISQTLVQENLRIYQEQYDLQTPNKAQNKELPNFHQLETQSQKLELFPLNQTANKSQLETLSNVVGSKCGNDIHLLPNLTDQTLFITQGGWVSLGRDLTDLYNKGKLNGVKAIVVAIDNDYPELKARLDSAKTDEEKVAVGLSFLTFPEFKLEAKDGRYFCDASFLNKQDGDLKKFVENSFIRWLGVHGVELKPEDILVEGSKFSIKIDPQNNSKIIASAENPDLVREAENRVKYFAERYMEFADERSQTNQAGDRIDQEIPVFMVDRNKLSKEMKAGLFVAESLSVSMASLTAEQHRVLRSFMKPDVVGHVRYSSQKGTEIIEHHSENYGEVVPQKMIENTVVGMGSTTKSFTAAILLKLWDGELTRVKEARDTGEIVNVIPLHFPHGIKTPLNRFMDGLKAKFPECAELFKRIEQDEHYKKGEITLEHLLNHTHGLGARNDTSPNLVAGAAEENRALTLSEIANITEVRKGEVFGKFNYGNFSFDLAAMIIEVVASNVNGKEVSFDEAVRKYAVPKGMEKEIYTQNEISTLDVNGIANAKGRYYGKQLDAEGNELGEFRTYDFNGRTNTVAAGGFKATAHALAIFCEQFYGGTMFANKEVKAAIDGVAQNGEVVGSIGKYGLGMFAFNDGTRGHPGYDYTQACEARYNPETKSVSIDLMVMQNLDNEILGNTFPVAYPKENQVLEDFFQKALYNQMPTASEIVALTDEDRIGKLEDCLRNMLPEDRQKVQDAMEKLQELHAKILTKYPTPEDRSQNMGSIVREFSKSSPAIVEVVNSWSKGSQRDEQFPILSISKTFCGAVCALMATDRKANGEFDGKFGEKGLNATIEEALLASALRHPERAPQIGKFLAMLEAKGMNNIKLVDLLHHTGGIGEPVAPSESISPYKDQPIINFIQDCFTDKGDRGTHRYSNAGYVFLEQIMNFASESGSYKQELKTRILDELEMTNTCEIYDSKAAMARVGMITLFPGVSKPYGGVAKETLEYSALTNWSGGKIPLAAGGLASTVNDMQIFGVQLGKMVTGQENLLANEAQTKVIKRMYESAVIDGSNSGFAGYSLGVEMGTNEKNEVVIKHGGALHANRASLEITIREKPTVFFSAVKQEYIADHGLISELSSAPIHEYLKLQLDEVEIKNPDLKSASAKESYLKKRSRLPKEWSELRGEIYSGFQKAANEILSKEYIGQDGLVDRKKLADNFVEVQKAVREKGKEKTKEVFAKSDQLLEQEKRVEKPSFARMMAQIKHRENAAWIDTEHTTKSTPSSSPDRRGRAVTNLETGKEVQHEEKQSFAKMMNEIKHGDDTAQINKGGRW